jgi:hypothetical protein
VKQSKDGKAPARVPSSGRGASSALDAMIRKRIPAPTSQSPSPAHGKSASPQAASRKHHP